MEGMRWLVGGGVTLVLAENVKSKKILPYFARVCGGLRGGWGCWTSRGVGQEVIQEPGKGDLKFAYDYVKYKIISDFPSKLFAI